jgi:plastocyanin
MPKVARRFVIAAILVVAGALGVAALASAKTSLSLRASKTALKFNTGTLRAAHGTVTITMTNPGSTRHAVAIKGHGTRKVGKTVGRNKTSTVTVTLKKGTYTFYCPVDGHEAAGMKGKLIVS